MYWWDETYYAGVSWFYEMLRVQISQFLKEGSSRARTLTPWTKVKQNTCKQSRSPHGNQQIFDYISKNFVNMVAKALVLINKCKGDKSH